MAIGFMKKISPEYVLKKAVEDMEQTGLDGLKLYLTEDAIEKIKMVQMFSGGIELFSNIGVSGIISPDLENETEYAAFLIDHLSECEWTVIDVSKGSSTAKGLVGFNYKDKLKGTVELSMMNDDNEWKINRIKMPKYEKVSD